jgi:RNA polymerase sigma-70 factor, ECF subfamily
VSTAAEQFSAPWWDEIPGNAPAGLAVRTGVSPSTSLRGTSEDRSDTPPEMNSERFYVLPRPGSPRDETPGQGPSSEYDPNVRVTVNSGSQRTSKREERRQEAADDHDLIQRAKCGDRAAFETLVRRNQQRAYAVALALVRDEHDAREIVQEAFIRVHRGLQSFKGTATFFTWLYRIVTNLSIDLVRKPSRRDSELVEPSVLDTDFSTPFAPSLDGADPADVAQRADVARAIQQALDDLPPYHRGVIVMRELEGMSYQEIAEAMGVSKGTVMSRLFHARQKLQRALASCYEEQFGKAQNRDDSP